MIDSKSEWFSTTNLAFQQVLQQVASILNDIHSVNYSIRYWNVFAGAWLQQFVDLVIAQVSAKSFDASTNLVYFPPAQTMREFQRFAKNTDFIKQLRSDINLINCGFTSKDEVRANVPIQTRADGLVTKNSRAFLSSTYLSRFPEFLLQLRFGRLPKPLRPAELQKHSIDASVRNSIAIKIGRCQSISQLIISLFPKYMPIVFLESYKFLPSTPSPWKSKRFPKVIFTSNRHLYDDVFNFWTAQAIEAGSRLVIGQHGGYYGISEFPSYAERHEKQVADRYLTWGWSNTSNAIAGPASIVVWKKPLKRIDPKHLLVVTDQLFTIPRSLFSDIGEFSSYLSNIKDLVDGLINAKPSVLIRIPVTHSESGHSQIDWFNDHLPHVAIDTGKQRFRHVLNHSKLVVIPHNGTTLIESIALEVPTVIVWDKSIVWMRSESEFVFNALEEVGIFHSTPNSAATFINSIWSDVDAWWNSQRTIDARKLFTDKYAQTTPKPLRFLAKTLQF